MCVLSPTTCAALSSAVCSKRALRTDVKIAGSSSEHSRRGIAIDSTQTALRAKLTHAGHKPEGSAAPREAAVLLRLRRGRCRALCARGVHAQLVDPPAV